MDKLDTIWKVVKLRVSKHRSRIGFIGSEISVSFSPIHCVLTNILFLHLEFFLIFSHPLLALLLFSLKEVLELGRNSSAWFTLKRSPRSHRWPHRSQRRNRSMLTFRLDTSVMIFATAVSTSLSVAAPIGVNQVSTVMLLVHRTSCSTAHFSNKFICDGRY